MAVVDSGMHFAGGGQMILGDSVANQFLGQVDFLAQGRCNGSGPHYTQHATYCETNEHTSTDPYGHGSHVASTILNHFKDKATGVRLGIAPGAEILSVRVLDDLGVGTYEDVIEGIQYIVANKAKLNIQVMNLSLVAYATTPYFIDPINRAAEEAWRSGITVVAAAGNAGPGSETITVPGNDPYVITVGALDSNHTAGEWGDDSLPTWASTGPTLDGFIKPDVIAPGANIVAYMYNDPQDINNSAYLARKHPNNTPNVSLFEMSGTSMSTAVVSGIVALMLEENPGLTPEQVKFRLMYSAQSSVTDQGELTDTLFQQGSGRVWAPDSVLRTDIPRENANAALNINADLGHSWTVSTDQLPTDLYDTDGDNIPNEINLEFEEPSSDNDTFIDTFSRSAYDNNEGTLNWSGAWKESDRKGRGPTGGEVRIINGELRLNNYSYSYPHLSRDVDLSGATHAELSFNYRTSGNLERDDKVSLWLYSNTGGWRKLETFADDSSDSAQYDITKYISGNMTIFFWVENRLGGYTEYFYIDNVEINAEFGTKSVNTLHRSDSGCRLPGQFPGGNPSSRVALSME